MSRKKSEVTETEKRPLGLRIAAWIGAGLFVLAVGFTAGWLGHYFSLGSEMRSFLWAKGITERYYYREFDRDVFYEKLFGTLDLDPYTQYYAPEEYGDYVESGAGHNMGIGVSLINEEREEGTLPRIFSVVENSPAARAGLGRGAYLFGYGETEEEARTSQWGGSEQFTKFLGEREDEICLRYGYSADGSDSLIVRLKRSNYQAAYVYYRDSGMGLHFRYPYGEKIGSGLSNYAEETDDVLSGADDKTAYIRIDEFNGLADGEFEVCLSEMKARGRENLILDLRSNGGGYLDILCKISSHLMKEGQGNAPIVAKAVYRDGSEEIFRAETNDYSRYFPENGKVAVLADESTASASEALIGALIDYGTVAYSGVFLREENGVAKTFGKGIMQSHFEHPLTGAAMKLTVAYIAWPLSGRCIQDVGVTKEDGAVAVPAQKLWGADDPMLGAALSFLG